MLNHSEIENPDSQQREEQRSFPVTDQSRAQVLVVEDGLEGALALHPDLILCDVSMPRMSGEQLVTMLRAQPDFDDVPIVVLSGRTDEQLRIQLLRAGAQDYLI